MLDASRRPRKRQGSEDAAEGTLQAMTTTEQQTKKPYEAPKIDELGSLHTLTLHDPHCRIAPCLHHSSANPH
jgi:hypothetical protein